MQIPISVNRSKSGKTHCLQPPGWAGGQRAAGSAPGPAAGAGGAGTAPQGAAGTWGTWTWGWAPSLSPLSPDSLRLPLLPSQLLPVRGLLAPAPPLTPRSQQLPSAGSGDALILRKDLPNPHLSYINPGREKGVSVRRELGIS